MGICTILMKWRVLFGMSANSRVILTSQRLSDSSYSKIRAWKAHCAALPTRPSQPTSNCSSEAAPYVESRRRKAHRFIEFWPPIGLGAGVAIPEDARNGTRDRGVVCPYYPKLP